MLSYVNESPRSWGGVFPEALYRRESQCVFKSTLRPSKRTHSKTLNYKNSDQSVHTARKNDDLFARAPKFPKIFRAQNLEKLTRPENFGAPHGRPTTRDEILRRDPKFQARAPKFSRRAARRNMLPKLGLLIPRTTLLCRKPPHPRNKDDFRNLEWHACCAGRRGRAFSTLWKNIVVPGERGFSAE